jgi:capsular exopolysaccharide synthesis family protein
MAAAVANGVAESFINHNFQAKTERFTGTSNWLEESTRKLKAQVEQAEAALANYSRENNIFSLEGKENLTAGKLVQLHDQVMRAETDRLLKQSLYEEVKRGRVAQLPEAFADPKTAELRKTLNELAVTASQVSVKFGAKHPKLVEIRQQMNTIQEQIDSNKSMLEEKLRADYERAVREEGSLEAALNRAKTEAVQQNQAAIQYSVLQQDLATAKSLYTDFLNKTSQANIQRAEQYNNVRLIEAAEPPGAPVGPNRAQAILIGFFLSLAFGVGLAYLLERLNTTVRNVEDVSRSTQLPTLAVIPSLQDKSLSAKQKAAGELRDGSEAIAQALGDRAAKAILSDSNMDFSAATEAYRMLRTSVLLSTAGHPPKIILVTSGQPGDGKTTTVYNTAIAFTQLKAHVLVIDCDMRKPRIHSMARIKREQGLSTFLSSGGELAELIKQTPIPYLSVLPCGHIPPNPSELISSEKMKEMLSFLSNHYDYIFIDSPPLVTVTDPLILSTLVDGVILVVKSGKSKSEIARRACQDLAGVGAKIFGVVLNDLDVKSEGYDHYNYSRYYADYIDQAKSNGAGA